MDTPHGEPETLTQHVHDLTSEGFVRDDLEVRQSASEPESLQRQERNRDLMCAPKGNDDVSARDIPKESRGKRIAGFPRFQTPIGSGDM
jgi:hypothetical protein